MKHLISLILLLQVVSAEAGDWKTANLSIVDQFAVPGYERLRHSSAELHLQANRYCAHPGEQKLAALRDSFHAVMDDWQHVQMLRKGPVELYMRHFRIQIWPDRHNTGAKQLRKLLSDQNPEILEQPAFAKTSIAVQGLSAMERLLFPTEAVTTSFLDNSVANYRCDLLRAISLNLENISGELLDAWRDEYREVIASPSAENDYFETDEEVASQFLQELHTQLQAITDQKFKRPLDGKIFKPKRAESWRSGRSLRNILLNLEAVEQLYSLGFSGTVTDAELKRRLEKQFQLAGKLGAGLQMPLQQAYEQQPGALSDWWETISELKRMVGAELPLAIGLSLGFNSLDGD